MRKLQCIIFILAAISSCTRFDDGDIWDKLREHEERILKLEQLCIRLNEEISAQQSILVALQGYDYVTGVTDIIEDGKVVGYTICFSKGESINIYHGLDGTDCSTPSIGIRKSSDGEYYWTVDGENMEYQAEVLVPKLKVEDGVWYVSYDNGLTWRELYPADIDDEDEGDSFFEAVDTSDPDYILITLVTGEQIKLPTWKAFQKLQTQVNKMNTSISSLQNIIVALQNRDYVVDVQPVIVDDMVVGHTIFFSKSLPVTIYHGNDGEDGNIPVIGVKKGEDETYYWTVNGEWILDAPDTQFPSDNDSYWVIDGEWIVDENGNKVPAGGSDGKDASTPQLKIEAGYWYVSFDGGRTWFEEPLGPVSGTADESIFSEISYDEDYLHLALKNGEIIRVPRHPNAKGISYSLELFSQTYHSVTFIGNVGLAEADLAFCRVTIYYSDSEDFNIHTAQSASTQTFDYNGNFSLCIDGLDCSTAYRYSIHIESMFEEVYGPVLEFETDERVAEVLDLSLYTDVGGYLSSNNGFTTWVNSHSTYFHYQIPLADMGYPSWITITANASQSSYIAFFKAKATSVHQSLLPPYSSGLDGRIVMTAGTTQTFNIPADAEYIYLLSRSSAGSHAPELIEYQKR